MRWFENFEKALYDGCGYYEFPPIKPEITEPPRTPCAVNDFGTCKQPEDHILHFYEYDYKFVRFWEQPDKYIERLKKFGAVISPDFSMYTDMPKAMQIYNHFRSHWLAAYWQEHGIRVYPNISWSTPDSYDWAFDGEPEKSVVAVSSHGVLKEPEAKKLFLQGYDEMIKRLDPIQIIWYGTVPEECDWNVIRLKQKMEVYHGQWREQKRDC